MLFGPQNVPLQITVFFFFFSDNSFHVIETKASSKFTTGRCNLRVFETSDCCIHMLHYTPKGMHWSCLKGV